MTSKHARMVLDNPSFSFPLRWAEKEDTFTFKDYSKADYTPENAVWVRGEYDRGSRKYCCHKWADLNHTRMVSADTLVHFYFTF